MLGSDLAEIAGCKVRYIQEKTKQAFKSQAEFVMFNDVKYGFELVKRGRGRPAYHYWEIISEVEPTPFQSEHTTNSRSELTLDEKQQAKLDLKLKVMSTWGDYKRAKKGTVKEFIEYVQEEFGMHYTYRMHNEWEKHYKKHGASALIDKRGNKKGTIRALNEHQQRYIISCFRAFGAGEVNYKQLWEELHRQEQRVNGFDYMAWKSGQLKNLCDSGVVKRFIDNYYQSRVLEWTLVTMGEDFNKSYNQPALGDRTEQFTYKNECWEIDSTPADVIIFHEGKQMRPDILAIKDVFSGRCVAVLAVNSNALAIIRLLWKAINELGMPKTIKGDNGKDYLSKQFKNLLDNLGIKYDRATAYAGDEKGMVERAFRTLQHSYMRMLVGFIGHNVSHRQKIEQQTAKKYRTAKDSYGNPVMTQTDSDALLSWDEFDARLQEAVCLWEIDKKRRTTPSPAEKWNSCIKPVRRISYESFLIYAGGYTERTVQKDGIHFNGLRFISSFIPKYRKQKVYVSENIDNISELFVFDTKGELIGVVVDSNISEMRKEDFVKVKKEHKKEVAEIQKGIKSDKVSMRTRSSAKADLVKAQDALKEKLAPVKEVVIRDVKLEERTKVKRRDNNIAKYLPEADEDDPFLQFG